MICSIQSPISDISYLISVHDKDTSVLPQIKKGYYERHVQLLISQFCMGGNILDIGSNYGQHSLYMSKLFPISRIVAIEAFSENINFIKESIKLNNIENIEVIQAFLADTEKEIECCYWPELSACAFGCDTDYAEKNHNEYKRTVTTQTLDSIINFVPDFIKMDIEGSELFAINGGLSVFSHCPNLMLELNNYTSMNFFGFHISVLVQRLIELGYNIGYIVQNKNIYSLQMQDIINITNQQNFVIMDVLFSKI